MLVIFIVVEWWFMYENHVPTLRNLALKVLYKTASSSVCEKEHIFSHTYKTNKSFCLPYAPAISFCYYNMKLMIRDMQAKTDKIVEKNYLDLLNISTEFADEEDNQLFQWVRPLHLDYEDENPNPRKAAHVREASVDVERVSFEEVHSESFS